MEERALKRDWRRLQLLKPHCASKIDGIISEEPKEESEYDDTQMRAWMPSVFSQAAVITLSLQRQYSVCVCGNIEDGVVLETILIACTVKANEATVKGLSHV